MEELSLKETFDLDDFAKIIEVRAQLSGAKYSLTRSLVRLIMAVCLRACFACLLACLLACMLSRMVACFFACSLLALLPFLFFGFSCCLVFMQEPLDKISAQMPWNKNKQELKDMKMQRQILKALTKAQRKNPESIRAGHRQAIADKAACVSSYYQW